MLLGSFFVLINVLTFSLHTKDDFTIENQVLLRFTKKFESSFLDYVILQHQMATQIYGIVNDVMGKKKEEARVKLRQNKK